MEFSDPIHLEFATVPLERTRLEVLLINQNLATQTEAHFWPSDPTTDSHASGA